MQIDDFTEVCCCPGAEFIVERYIKSRNTIGNYESETGKAGVGDGVNSPPLQIQNKSHVFPGEYTVGAEPELSKVSKLNCSGCLFYRRRSGSYKASWDVVMNQKEGYPRICVWRHAIFNPSHNFLK